MCNIKLLPFFWRLEADNTAPVDIASSLAIQHLGEPAARLRWVSSFYDPATGH